MPRASRYRFNVFSRGPRVWKMRTPRAARARRAARPATRVAIFTTARQHPRLQLSRGTRVREPILAYLVRVRNIADGAWRWSLVGEGGRGRESESRRGLVVVSAESTRNFAPGLCDQSARPARPRAPIDDDRSSVFGG